MQNPNTSPESDYGRVENTLADIKPIPQDFKDRIYPAEEVERDIKQLEDYRRTPKYKKGEEHSEAILLEKTFIDMVERGDWFSEEEAYGDDLEYLGLVTVPASDIDDTFNHIDMIGAIKNIATGHETVPFAIDLTYNTDEENMTKKFKWRHTYGKKKNAPEGASEFGESYMTKDEQGNDVLETEPLQMRFRHGLKIPGFASAKYYEDKNNLWNQIYEKGRIDVMPRFIVGYSHELADTLSLIPNDAFRKRYGETAYMNTKKKYEKAEKCAKWCTLLECQKQASDIRFMMKYLDEDETKFALPAELEKAKRQIIAMDNYFTKAIEIATKNAEGDPDEIAAKEYASKDIVCQAIMKHSHEIYVNKTWKKN